MFFKMKIFLSKHLPVDLQGLLGRFWIKSFDMDFKFFMRIYFYSKCRFLRLSLGQTDSNWKPKGAKDLNS